jgi:hypothetical protein
MPSTCISTFFFFPILGFEFRTFHLSPEPYPYPFLLYFSNRVSLLCPGKPGPWSSYLCFSCSRDDRHAPPCPVFYLLRWDLMDFFCPSYSGTVILLISTSWVARITGFSHFAQLSLSILNVPFLRGGLLVSHLSHWTCSSIERCPVPLPVWVCLRE